VGRRSVKISRKHVLGRGGSAVVYEAVDIHSGQLLAVKEIIVKTEERPQIDRVRREIRQIGRLRFPNIVEYYGTNIVPDKMITTIRILMERQSSGTLLDQLRKFKSGLPEDVVWNYTEQILIAVREIHEQSVTHRDIKPENTLLTSDGVVKLNDFGTAMEGGNFSEIAGTAQYMPPETMELANESPSQKELFERAKAHDMWSVGATVYQLFTGRAPWSDTALSGYPLLRHMSSNGVGFTFTPALQRSPKIDSLVKQCCTLDWRSRPSAATMLHSWF